MDDGYKIEMSREITFFCCFLWQWTGCDLGANDLFLAFTLLFDDDVPTMLTAVDKTFESRSFEGHAAILKSSSKASSILEPTNNRLTSPATGARANSYLPCQCPMANTNKIRQIRIGL